MLSGSVRSNSLTTSLAFPKSLLCLLALLDLPSSQGQRIVEVVQDEIQYRRRQQQAERYDYPTHRGWHQKDARQRTAAGLKDNHAQSGQAAGGGVDQGRTHAQQQTGDDGVDDVEHSDNAGHTACERQENRKDNPYSSDQYCAGESHTATPHQPVHRHQHQEEPQDNYRIVQLPDQDEGYTDTTHKNQK